MKLNGRYGLSRGMALKLGLGCLGLLVGPMLPGTSGVAHAICHGQNVEATNNVPSIGASEITQVGTCNANKKYGGRISDNLTDGFDVTIWYKGLYGSATFAKKATSSVNYYLDDDNYSSTFKICLGTSGNTCAPEGVNWGY